MHLNVLNNQQQELLPLLPAFNLNFGLAGGTAVALQLGHRKSVDFDLFTLKKINHSEITNKIKQSSFQIDQTLVSSQTELSLIINQVKFTFLHYPYPIKYSQDFDSYINMPDLLSLGAIKVFTVGKRANWKDYVDLFFIFQELRPENVVKKARDIYGTEFNEKLFKVQLSYFNDLEDLDIEFMPGKEVDAKVIQQYLEDLVLTI